MEVIGLFLVSAGLAWWLGWQRHRVGMSRIRGLLGTVGEEADVALAVATREATQRGQILAPLHLLYGLLQDDAFVAAIAAVGGDAAAIEHRVLDDLDALVQAPDLARRETPDNAAFAVVMARLYARHHGRPVTCADLWHAIARTTAASLVQAGEADPGKLAFVLVHGPSEPRSTLAGETAVAIVLRNDDYTTAEFVVELLRDVFQLPDATAQAIMVATHTEGRGVIGRFDAATAKTRVEAAWARARAAGHPLWIAVEVS
ncbi:MAG: ATP-dependent Clp protease adaptor ClpS [Proteobacteria bacterium]|nr:ATP-dependent Clp protease adaptor ClpS [Pseudomonadota bacterium]